MLHHHLLSNFTVIQIYFKTLLRFTTNDLLVRLWINNPIVGCSSSLKATCWDSIYNWQIVLTLIASPFKVKINYSKFIIDGLQRRCHLTLLVYFFVILRNLLFGVFLPRGIIKILRKITLLSVRVLEYFGKILQKHL